MNTETAAAFFHAATEESDNKRVNIRQAIALLREARDLLKKAGALRAVEAVRAALDSAEGAERHASRAHYGPALRWKLTPRGAKRPRRR